MLFRAVLILTVLISTAAYADTYDVQIGAFRNPDVARIVLPANVGELRSISGPDGLTRFVVGPFVTRSEAEQARDTLKSSGFGGAFVRASDDGRTVISDSAYVSEAAAPTISQTDAQPFVSDNDQDGDVVYLDGQLHRKVGNQFIPIRD